MANLSRAAILVAVVALFGAAGMKGTEMFLMSGAARESTDQRGSVTRVTVARPAPRDVEESFSAVGTIYPIRSIELRPLSGGRVEEVAMTSGERVEEGDLLVRLDARAARAALDEAEATLAAARAQYERLQELSSENVASEAQIEEARAAFRRAEARADMAQVDLDDRRLTAPFAGTVGIVDIDRGQYVDPGTVVASLDDRSVVEAEFSMPEAYFDRVRLGQTVRITSGVYPDTSFEGQVSVKSPRVSETSRSFPVRVEIENSARRLTRGMFVRAEIVFDTYSAMTIPDDAVISEGDTSYVYTVADGTARRTELAVAADLEGRTAVREGLASDAQVVVTGWDTLSDGADVEVDDDAPASEALQ